MPEATGVLVGRRAELDALGGALVDLERGTGRVLQVAGEPGIGKTRLVAELCADAERRRHLVFSGRAAEFEEGEAFGLLVDALDDYLASVDPRQLEPLKLELAELAWVFPALARLAERPVGALPAERYRTHRAIRGLLDALARRRPLVLALDDVHWADSASVELISYLLRRPPKGRVLTVLAFRPAQLGNQFAAALDASTRTPGVVRLDLGALTEEEAAQLLGGGVGPALTRELFRLSGGNPFYLEQLARARQRAGADARGPGASADLAPVPGAVLGVIAEELGGLSPQAQALIRGGAVAGDPFELGLAASAGEVPPEGELAALDELLATDLVRPGTVPRRFAFRHPLVRQAVYDSAGGGWRIGAHARAAAALEAQGGSATARAHHVERSARPGDAGAVQLLVEAGHATAARAPAAAARWYEAALRLMPERQAERPRRLDVLVALAPMLTAMGRVEDSRAALSEALDLVPIDDTAGRLRLHASCAAVERLLGNYGAAHDRLHRAFSELPEPMSPEAAALSLEHAYAARIAGEFDATRTLAQGALDIATACGDLAVRAGAAALLAFVEAESPSGLDLVSTLQRSAALVDGMTDRELSARLEAVDHLGLAENVAGRLDDAIRHVERGITIARATGRGQHLLELSFNHAHVLAQQGRLAAATEVVDTAVEMARLSGIARSIAWAREIDCWVSAWRGDVEAALRAGEESVEMAGTLDQTWITSVAGSTLATVRLEMGDAERGRAQMLDAAGGPTLPRLGVQSRCNCYEALARAELALGHRDAADTWATQAETSAVQSIPSSVAAAHRARAEVLLAAGEAGRAAALALDAAAAEDDSGARVAAARSRTLAGRALAAGERRDEAVATLKRAEAELSDCGAARFADEAARELRRLGRRVTRAGRRAGSDELGLTRREIEVARLVTAGKSNREIAAELFLSEKTVETHLSNVFTKLGVTSRAAVAAVLARKQD